MITSKTQSLNNQAFLIIIQIRLLNNFSLIFSLKEITTSRRFNYLV